MLERNAIVFLGSRALWSSREKRQVYKYMKEGVIYVPTVVYISTMVTQEGSGQVYPGESGKASKRTLKPLVSHENHF